MEFQERVKEYAEQINCPVEIAERRLKCFDKLQEIIDAAKVCPKCGKPTLEFEMGSYYEQTPDVIYCDNEEGEFVVEDGEEYYKECDFVSDVEKKYEVLQFGYDHDMAFAHAMDNPNVESFDGMSWEEYVLKDTIKMEKELFPTIEATLLETLWTKPLSE